MCCVAYRAGVGSVGVPPTTWPSAEQYGPASPAPVPRKPVPVLGHVGAVHGGCLLACPCLSTPVHEHVCVHVRDHVHGHGYRVHHRLEACPCPTCPMCPRVSAYVHGACPRKAPRGQVPFR